MMDRWTADLASPDTRIVTSERGAAVRMQARKMSRKGMKDLNEAKGFSDSIIMREIT